MPLYMDLHADVDVDLEELRKLHLADLEVQEKYGVRYHKYWVNEESGMVFCLMHGPNKQACEAVHREAHGNIACNIIEVLPGEYEFFLGQAASHSSDMVQTANGVPDTGFRTIVFTHVISRSSTLHTRIHEIVKEELRNCNGIEIEHLGEGVKSVFTSFVLAIDFAVAVRSKIEKFKKELGGSEQHYIELRIGLCAGDPVKNNSDKFFGGALDLAKRFSEVAKEGEIVISSVVKDYFIKEDVNSNYLGVIKVVDYPDEKFLNRLLQITDEKLGEHTFNVENLGRDIGLSRPQLYRRITSLTGLSPNDFIREKRLKSAIKLIKKNYGNISEIALEVGFNSPSYFSKCFHERFGLLPSAYLK